MKIVYKVITLKTAYCMGGTQMKAVGKLDQGRVQPFTGPRFWAIVPDRSAVGHVGSNFNADPHELQVTWRSVYNDDVWLYGSYLRIERYL